MGRLPTVDIITVSKNSGHLLIECLESIGNVRKNGLVLNRVVVIDNASTDGSCEGLHSLALPIELIRNERDLGYGASCNVGARSSRADYLLFLNPDARLYAESLETPLVFMENAANHSVGICGIQLIDDAGVVSRSCSRLPTAGQFLAKSFGLEALFPSRFRGLFMTEWDHSETRRVDHVMGAYSLIRRSVFESLGGFDERFFVYMEDVDLSARAMRRGWPTMFLATAKAYHKGGGTSKRIPALSLSYALRSRLQYSYKQFDWWSATTVMLAAIFVEPVVRILGGLAHRSIADIRTTLAAYWLLTKALPCIFLAKPRVAPFAP